MVVGIDVQNDGLNALTLLQYLRRMFDAPGRNVGNVDKAVDSFFDFYECAEVGQVAYTAGDHGTDRVALGESAPRIGFSLLQTEGNAAIIQIDIQNDSFNILSQLKHLC